MATWKAPSHPNGVSGGKKTTTTITKKDGTQASGYISNGKTYYSDGTRIGVGDSVTDTSGRQWTMGSDGKGTLTGYAEGARSSSSNKPASGKFNTEYGYSEGSNKDYYISALEKQLKAQQDEINQQKQAAINGINNDYEAQQKANYIAKARGLNQAGDMMNYMGYSGGMAESTLANINNDYLNNRYTADQNRNSAVQQAEATGSAQMASAKESYLDRLKNAIQLQKQEEEQEKSDYANTIGAYYDDYQAQINKLLGAGVPEDDYRIKLLKGARQEKIANQNAAALSKQQQNFENEIAWQKLLNDNAKTNYTINKPYYKATSSKKSGTNASTAWKLYENGMITEEQLYNYLGI